MNELEGPYCSLTLRHTTKNNVELSYTIVLCVIVVRCFIVSLWALQTPGGLVWKRTKLLILERSIATTIAMDMKNRKRCASRQLNQVSSNLLELSKSSVVHNSSINNKLYWVTYIIDISLDVFSPPTQNGCAWSQLIRTVIRSWINQCLNESVK